MLRATLGLVLAGCLAGCGSPPKKHVEHPEQSAAKRTARSLLSEARDDVRNGDLDAADKAYADAYDAAKQFDVLQERVDFLEHSGRAGKAVTVAKAYYDANISDVKGYSLYADALLAADRGSDALDVAKQILGFNDQDPDGHAKMGRALILLGKTEDGLDELHKAVHLAPDSAEYHKQLGEALNAAGSIDEAALEFRAAIKADPDDADALVSLGEALRGQREYDDALKYLNKAIDLDPRNGRAYFELGLLYNVQRRQADSEQALQKAVQLSPNNSLFWYALGEIYRVQQRDDEALKAYRKAVDIDPPYLKALQKLGLLLIERKQYADAEVPLTDAARRDKDNPLTYFELGQAYAGQHKTRAAIDAYAKYLDLAPKDDPDRRRAKELMEELKRR